MRATRSRSGRSPAVEDLAAGIELPGPERPAVAGLGDPAPPQQVPAGTVEHGVLERGGVLVAGRAVDRPGVREALAGGEDLLHEQPAIGADRLAEPGQVGERVGQSVDVVDAYAGERRVLGEQARDGVDGRGHLGVLDAHGHEVVDGEEAAYVARRVPPVLQAVVLPGEQLVDRQLLGARPQRPPLRAEAQLAGSPLEAIDVERARRGPAGSPGRPPPPNRRRTSGRPGCPDRRAASPTTVR